MENGKVKGPLDGLESRILQVDPHRIGRFSFSSPDKEPFLHEWDLTLASNQDAASFSEAVEQLKYTSTPVAFPTETVYGLGADATRSAAVRGIFQVKQRPLDNPLIVHVCSLQQLRSLLESSPDSRDPIPAIYLPLIHRFWPGPLTILLPLSPSSCLAPEVTAGLDTFGARMPSSLLALALIRAVGAPLAAPSANASTKPSPTTAAHVKHDLEGRIKIILDGGPCHIGVESTVVDGLSNPPSILRPGGVSIEQLRECPGWEDVMVGYKDRSEKGMAPRAPGMKYKHYSPKARVFLVNPGTAGIPVEKLELAARERAKTVGIVRTKAWANTRGLLSRETGSLTSTSGVVQINKDGAGRASTEGQISEASKERDLLWQEGTIDEADSFTISVMGPGDREPVDIRVWDVSIGPTTANIARGLFSALRELDLRCVDIIFVESIDEDGGDTAAAVMNRLRKAAEIELA